MPEQSGRYLIIGAGAIGMLLAVQWTLAGRVCTLIARGRAHEVISERGVTIRRPRLAETVRVEAAASIAEAAPRSGDVIVLSVKTQDAAAALADIAWLPLADGSGVVADLEILTLQNGLATEDLALRRFARVVGVSVGTETSYLQPGEVVCTSFPVVGLAWIGSLGGADPEAEERHRDGFEAAGLTTWIEPDIMAAKRRKLIGNLHNGLEVFRAEPEELDRALQAVRAEAVQLFAELGLPVAPPTPGARLEIEEVEGHTQGLSTWQSFTRGSSSEGDYLNGEVVLIARQHGRTAPLNAAVQRALGALSARGGKPGEIALADVLPTDRASE